MTVFPFASFFLCIVALLLPAAATAQRAEPSTPHLVIAAPLEQPIALESVKVHTDIRGSFAVTSVEMRFLNPNRRTLEGELQFPLLDGQRVIGMAMDIDGKLRDAVAVEKTRGQAVFEEVTRAQIDPALLQVTQGNNYKLRVYPILPGSRKTVVIRYAETLAVRDGNYRFVLPLSYAGTLPAFELTITVADKPSRTVRKPDAIGTLEFDRTGTFYTARVTRERIASRGTLEIAIPAPERPRAYTQVLEGRTYFYAELPVAETYAPRRAPQTLGLIWDSSGSGAQRDHARELALLEAYFRRAGNVEVRLIRLRERAEPAERYTVRKGDWSALRRALDATVYDGATSFASLQPATHGVGVDEYLLFSDGLENFGGARFPVTKVPVYSVGTALKTDGAALRRIAEASGGRHVDLLTDRPDEAARKLLSAGARIVSMDATGATQLVSASAFPENGLLRIAGIVNASNGGTEVRVGIGQNGQAPRIMRIPLKSAESESPHAAHVWASLRTADLEGEHRLNRAEILRIGKAFGIVTRETSLIVLDRLEDYVRFEIEPPAELTADYQRQLSIARQRRTTDRQSQLERVVKLFEQKGAWWARNFPKDDRPPAQAIAKPAMAPRAAPMAKSAASPPPPAPVAAERAESRASIGVRGAAGGLADAARASTDAAAPQIGIQLKRWTSDAPYIARFAKAEAKDLYRIYLDERPGYASSTAFYLDAADQLLDKGQTDLGVRVLSNLAEMDLENRHVLRILGYRLLQAGRPQLAIPVFEQVLALAPEEPQSYRDLGLAYAADRQYQKTVDTLYDVVVKPWHGRFPEVELIALAELNAIIAEAGRAGATPDLARIDPRLLQNQPLDVRVVLTWDADDTDIDLWVTDPNGEKAYYGHRLSYQGGRMSPDFTGGYGPEEFSLKTAKPGKYTVQVNFYGHRRQTVAGATTLQVKFVTGFGTAQQKEQMVTLRLRDRSEVVAVGEFEVAAIR